MTPSEIYNMIENEEKNMDIQAKVFTKDTFSKSDNKNKNN